MNTEFAIAAKNIVSLNPKGHIAICTLWTPQDYVLKILERGGIDVSPTSPLALIGGLYGGGLKIMLRNLAYNPQIDRLILFGKDFSGVSEHLVNFFAGCIERTGRRRTYIFADGSRRELELISISGRDCVYTMDELLLPEHFERPPQISDISFSRPDVLLETLREFTQEPVEGRADRPRLFIELPRPETDVYPSEPHSHVVTASSITEAWEKMLYRLARFGQPVTFRDGKKRHELLNMKAVITEPGAFDKEALARLNLPEAEIRQYQARLISAEFTEADGSYSYGNRMRAYFGRDMLAVAAEDLSKNLDSRHNFITLWDNAHDVEAPESPCLVSLFFRKRDDQLDLTATFRSHNGARAWPRNCFGLYKIMEEVCTLANEPTARLFETVEHEDCQLRPGTLTVLSLSISIDPADLDHVQGYIDDYKNRHPHLSLDPCGYVKIAVDTEAREIVLQHYSPSPDNDLLDEYRGDNPSAMARELYQREVISDISHAMYIGMQLERAWSCLLNGEEYVQDKTVPLKMQ